MDEIKMVRPAKVMIIERVYHQIGGEQPVSVETIHSKPLRSDDSPYQRPDLPVNEEWRPLDTGWVKEVGMIHIKNPPPQRRTIPTPLERFEDAKKIIELSFDLTGEPNFWLIHPGDTFRGYPCSPKLFIRCRKGETRCSITIYPV